MVSFWYPFLDAQEYLCPQATLPRLEHCPGLPGDKVFQSLEVKEERAGMVPRRLNPRVLFWSLHLSLTLF